MNFPKQDHKGGAIFTPLIITALVIALFSQISAAQEYQSFRSERELILSKAKIRLGPLLFFPDFSFSLNYDSNVYGGRETTSLVSDYFVSLSIPLNGHLLVRDWLIVSFIDRPTYNHYFQLTKERALDNSYSAGIRLLLLNRFSLSGSRMFSRGKQRYTTEIDRRIFGTSEGYNVGLFLDTIRDTSVGFSGSVIDYQYEDTTLPGSEVPISKSLSRVEKDGRFELYYRIFSSAHFFGNIGYTQYTFNNPEASFRDSHSYQANAGIRFPIFGNAAGRFSLGYKKFVPDQVDFQGYAGIVGDTSLSLSLGRFNFRIEYIRDIPFSYTGNIFYIENTYGAGISFYLGQFLRLSYNFSSGINNYPRSQDIVPPPGTSFRPNREDKFASHGGGLVLRVYRSIGIGLGVDYWARTSSDARANIKRTTIGAYLTNDF